MECTLWSSRGSGEQKHPNKIWVRKKKKEWMTDEIPDMMKKRQQTIPMNSVGYRTLIGSIWNKCTEVARE